MRKIDSGLHYPLDLNTLSKTWSVSYIGDVAIEIQPGFASGEHNQEGTGIPHVRPMNINRQGNLDLSVVKYVSPDRDKKRLRAGDVLFNNTNSPELIGKTTVINKDNDWAFSNHMTRIVFPQEVSPKFVAYQLHFLWSMGYYLHKCVKHVNQASISSKTLGDSVPLILAPFDEQKLIVSEIEKQFSRLDEAVAALKRVRAGLKRYKASVLKAAVEGRIVTSEQKKWKTTTVGEVSEIVTKGSSPNWQGFEYSSEGVVFVRSQNVAWGHLDLSDVAHLPLAFNKKEKKSVLRTGDVLLNIVGASIGRAAVASKSIEGGNINQAVAVIRPLRDRLLPQFLMCYFLSEKVQKLIHAQKVDVARANYSLEQIRKLPLHLPPLDDQHLIVEEIESRLSVAEEIEETININLKRAERLRQAILKKAFSGRLV